MGSKKIKLSFGLNCFGKRNRSGVFFTRKFLFVENMCNVDPWQCLAINLACPSQTDSVSGTIGGKYPFKVQ